MHLTWAKTFFFFESVASASMRSRCNQSGCNDSGMVTARQDCVTPELNCVTLEWLRVDKNLLCVVKK